MARLTIELPPLRTLTEFNLGRWAELQPVRSSKLCPEFPAKIRLR